MRVVTLDTRQALPVSLTVDKTGIAFLRRGKFRSQHAFGAAVLLVRYCLGTDGFQCQIGPEGSQPEWQLFLPHVLSFAWQLIVPPLPAPCPAPVTGLDLKVQVTAHESTRGVFALPRRQSLRLDTVSPECGMVLFTMLKVMALCVTVIVAMTSRSELVTLATARRRDQSETERRAALPRPLACPPCSKTLP